MSDSNFKWQTDDEENLIRTPGGEKSQQKGRKFWLNVGAFLLISIICLLMVRYISQRQRRMEGKVRQDVETSFDLWQQAIEKEDPELYKYLLGNGDRDWLWKQRALFEQGLILERDFLSLTKEDGVHGEPEVNLSPDWQLATVTFEQLYGNETVTEFEETVRLQHTIVFANEDSSWMQIAPNEDFWGDWMRMESDLLVIHFPQRDQEMARRIGRRLEADLTAICTEEAGAGDKCIPFKPFVLTMSPDSESLLALEAAAGPLLSRSNFRMPSPTIVGLPADEMSFQVYYHGYTHEILDHVRNEVGSPTQLPDQLIRTLCFNHPNLGPKLYKYIPAYGIWEAELPDRNFRFLLPLDGDQALILDEIARLEEPGHSRLIKWSEEREEVLLDEATVDNPYRVISLVQDGGSQLLLRRLIDDQLNYAYKRLDLTSCTESGCDLQKLPGYTIWSPEGERTILHIGSDIFLGNDEGKIEEAIGRGFSPFWLNEDVFVSIRFVEKKDRLHTALFMNQTSSGKERIIFDDRNLAEAAGVDENGLSMRFVTANPGNGTLLLVHALGLNDYAGEYFLFSVQLPSDNLAAGIPEILLRVRRRGSLGGDTGLVTSSGYLPFSPSPDGRWLLISELSGFDPAARTFLLHDLHANKTRIIAEGETVMPAQFPSYDWSDDGRWLAIAGDGFFRLIAPAEQYEQLVPHDFDACGFVRWSD